MIGGYFLINHIKMKNEILESLRPWDCQIFEKDPCSPFICFGGGAPPKPKIVEHYQSQAQGAAEHHQRQVEGGSANLVNQVEQGAAHYAKGDYSLGTGMKNLASGIQSTVETGIGAGGKLLEGGRDAVRDIFWKKDQGSGSSEDSASANYSSKSSRKRGEQKGKKDAILSKSKERVAKREDLKVRRKA